MVRNLEKKGFPKQVGDYQEATVPSPSVLWMYELITPFYR